MFFKTSKFLTLLTPFVALIVTTSTLFPYITGKTVTFRLLIGVAFILFLIGIINDEKRSKEYWDRFVGSIRSPFGIAIGIFTFIFLLAGFFGVDPLTSFWSNFERGEGGLQILFLYVFFLLASTLFRNKEDWKKFFSLFIVAAFLSVLYGLGSGLGVLPGDGRSLSKISRFQGSLGNPAYFATYLLFALFFAFYLLRSKAHNITKSKKVWLISSIVVFIFFFLWAATRGAFLGLLGALVVAAIYLSIVSKRWRKPIIVSSLALAVLLGGGYAYQDTGFVQDLPASRLYNLSIDTKNFQQRLIMWNMSIEAVKDSPVLGYGPENFKHIFYNYYDPTYYDPVEQGAGNFGPWFDRAHSTTFDYLTQTGVLGLLSYWAIFALFFVMFIRVKMHKKEKPLLAALMLALPVAYFIQGQVLFEVLTIYIPLYAFLAFSGFLFAEYQEQDKGLFSKIKNKINS